MVASNMQKALGERATRSQRHDDAARADGNILRLANSWYAALSRWYHINAKRPKIGPTGTKAGINEGAKAEHE